MKEIIFAPHSGFCFGVKRALEMIPSPTEDKKIYTCGPIIHNKRVTDDLRNRGVCEIGSPSDGERGAVIVVRSHGEGKDFYRQTEDMDMEVIDATCPFVERIHKLVEEAYGDGKQVVIVGDGKHPEVKGINGWCENSAIIIKDEKEAKEIFPSGLKNEKDRVNAPIFVVAQTTIPSKVFDSVCRIITENHSDVTVKNTICDATQKRQQGCMDTAAKVDVMLIVGDRHSSNTRKLYEISKKTCENTFFIENLSDLPLKEIEKYNKIGVAAGASTPEIAIKEVAASMSDKNTEQTMSMADFMDDIDKSLRLPRSGELVTGKVHQVTDEEIIVNLGCKKDGIIPLNEITIEGDKKLTDLYSEGDEIQAKVLKTDDGDGTILLSKKKLEAGEHWEEINKALEEKELIEVNVVRQVNGGVIAMYKEVSGFIPLSQLSDRFVEDSSEFVGQTLKVKVSRVDPRRGKAIFSHKMYLNEEKQKALEKIWENIHVDDIVKGKVMRFTDYGAFVDIGGIDGLLHISEISWGKLKHPQEVLSIGEEINVKILSMNAEKGKVSLGLKQTQPEPWSVIEDKYEVGQIVKGKVLQIKEYGCFVELEPGLDGLVHISQISQKRVNDINEEVSVGQEVETKILEIDKDRKRISLSIKEALGSVDEAKADEAAEEAPVEEAPAEEAAPVEEAPAEAPDEAVEESAPEAAEEQPAAEEAESQE